MTQYWLDGYAAGKEVQTTSDDDDLACATVDKTHLGIRPTITVDVNKIIEARKLNKDAFKVRPVYDEDGEIAYYTIEIGSFPQTIASKDERAILTSMFLKNDTALIETGKHYLGAYDPDINSCYPNSEFEYNGNKYVKVTVYPHKDFRYFSNGELVPDSQLVWLKVEPILWRIDNFDIANTLLHPDTLGHFRFPFEGLIADKTLLGGIPFNADFSKNCSMWQNSLIRACLNGYNLEREIKVNKNGIESLYRNKINYDYTDYGFIDSAFDDVPIETKAQIKPVASALPGKKKSRLEKLNPDTTPEKDRIKMTDSEVIGNWIDSGESVLLLGPSGIGKTERIKAMYPNLIYLKLTNNMFPEKVVGSVNLQTGQSIPPDFAKQAIMACATEQEKSLVESNIQNLYNLADEIYERSKSSKEKNVILLDELLNVKPAIQSLVYTLVLNKLVETGNGLKLPANTVIVATGNQKKYSMVAEDLAEPLAKRFDHILDMEPKVGEWIYEYAIPHKIHPMVIAYIFSKWQEHSFSDKIEDIGYFYEEPEVGERNLDKFGCRGKTNDPRGWVSISNTLYSFEEKLKNGEYKGKNVDELLKMCLRSKLREEWAFEFYMFYSTPALTPTDIVEKSYTQADLPVTINERFATVSGLLSATEEQLSPCRQFIKNYCDPEYLKLYDVYWAGNNEERMEKIVTLQQLDSIENDQEKGEVNEQAIN